MEKIQNSVDCYNALLDMGFKPTLLSKLTDEQLKFAHIYMEKHKNADNMYSKLVSLIAMESRNKPGVLFLAANNLATFTQLRNLHAEHIARIIELYSLYQDTQQVQHEVNHVLIHHHGNPVISEFTLRKEI